MAKSNVRYLKGMDYTKKLRLHTMRMSGMLTDSKGMKLIKYITIIVNTYL